MLFSSVFYFRLPPSSFILSDYSRRIACDDCSCGGISCDDCACAYDCALGNRDAAEYDCASANACASPDHGALKLPVRVRLQSAVTSGCARILVVYEIDPVAYEDFALY